MKILIILALCLLAAPHFALGQPQASIGVFSDAIGSGCDFHNEFDSMLVYVVLVNSPGATACQFRIDVMGAPLTYAGEWTPYLTIGNSEEGIAIAFAECLASPIHVLTVKFTGISDPCDMLRIEGDEILSPPEILMTDCSDPIPVLHTALGMAGYINNDGSCPCNVPVEDTTWGMIKALYR